MAEPLAGNGSGATREGIPTVMPPRWALLLLRLRFRGELGEVLTGDLLEGFHRIVDSGTGLKAARRWFRSQVLSSLTARPRRAGRWRAGLGDTTEGRGPRTGPAAGGTC